MSTLTDLVPPLFPINSGRMRMNKSVGGNKKPLLFLKIPFLFVICLPSADIIFQKSAKKRAEAAKMIEKEISAMSARQEKVDHKLKERIGEF